MLHKLFKRRKTLKQRYPQYQIGRESYGKPKIQSWKGETSKLKIGAFCSFASGVKILLGGNHQKKWVTTFPLSIFWDLNHDLPNNQAISNSKGNIIIGNDVWVGMEAMILSGVTIGDGAIIGARAVITKDVPPYTIVAGNPATIIGTRFDEHTIRRLLKVKWWDLEDSIIKQYSSLLLSPNIEDFLDFFEQNHHEVK